MDIRRTTYIQPFLQSRSYQLLVSSIYGLDKQMKNSDQAFITRYWWVRTVSTWIKSTKLHITKKTSHSGDPVSVHPLPCLATGTTVHINGVGTNFGVGVGEARPEEPRAGNGFLGRGQPAPPHQLGGLRERWGPGRSPGRRRVFLYSEPLDCLSQHLSTCCIQFAWLGIRFL